MTLGILLPAAGASTRMRGRDKLLEAVDGIPLLLRQARIASSTGLPVLVTLRPDNDDRAACLAQVGDSRLQTTVVPDAAIGISASLRAGARWTSNNRFSGLMVVLPDMPELTTEDLDTVAALHATHPKDVIRAMDDAGRYGHPTVLPMRLMPGIARLTGDEGARPVIAGETVRPCPLAGRRATQDLDTPEAWATWRARQR